MSAHDRLQEATAIAAQADDLTALATARGFQAIIEILAPTLEAIAHPLHTVDGETTLQDARRACVAFGKVLRSERLLRDMRMRELAEVGGVDEPTMSRIERGLVIANPEAEKRLVNWLRG